jgi:hypothetical protein
MIFIIVCANLFDVVKVMMPFLPISSCCRRLRIINLIAHPLSVALHETTHDQVPLQFSRKGVEQFP